MVRIFAVPLALAALSLAGLVVALLDDGLHDAFAWVALGLPVAVVPWAMWRAHRAARRRPVSTGAPVNAAETAPESC